MDTLHIRYHVNSRDCPHYNEHVCMTCDFDDYYRRNFPDCPWYEPREEDK